MVLYTNSFVTMYNIINEKLHYITITVLCSFNENYEYVINFVIKIDKELYRNINLSTRFSSEECWRQ